MPRTVRTGRDLSTRQRGWCLSCTARTTPMIDVGGTVTATRTALVTGMSSNDVIL